MKTAAIFASLVASAAAFAPASKKASSSVALNAFSDELGAQMPLGYFDPLGICKDGNKENFDRLRYVELKHGRVASTCCMKVYKSRECVVSKLTVLVCVCFLSVGCCWVLDYLRWRSLPWCRGHSFGFRRFVGCPQHGLGAICFHCWCHGSYQP